MMKQEIQDASEEIVLVDTHAHLTGEEYDEDRTAMLARAYAAGVRAVVNFGDTMQASAACYDLCTAEVAAASAVVYGGVGVHPENAVKLTPVDDDRLVEWAAHEKIVAIGEIGLDYYWEKDSERRALQREMFIHQLDLARQLHLPVCIHDREAHGDMMAILKKEGRGNIGVIHCFSGSFEMAKELLKLGWYLGIDGPITYKNAVKALPIVQYIPPDRLLIETDSPYLTPVPLRGKRNEPAFVRHTAAFAAELRGVSLAAFAAQTTENTRALYGIDV